MVWLRHIIHNSSPASSERRLFSTVVVSPHSSFRYFVLLEFKWKIKLFLIRARSSVCLVGTAGRGNVRRWHVPWRRRRNQRIVSRNAKCHRSEKTHKRIQTVPNDDAASSGQGQAVSTNSDKTTCGKSEQLTLMNLQTQLCKFEILRHYFLEVKLTIQLVAAFFSPHFFLSSPFSLPSFIHTPA